MPRRSHRSQRPPSTAIRLSQRRPAPEVSGPDPDTQIARINEISMIARTTWFGLLAYLAFVGITLLGVEDADFFVPSRQTQLPLVNVSIPTSAFFWFAPVLGAALYAYLHLQLLKLWEALAAPDPQIKGRHLSDSIYPWLISDYAIALRKDRATRHRPLAYLSYSVTWLLVWAAGPFVLAGFWWRSMPKHHEGLTLWIALALLVTLYVGLTSRWQACNLLWQTDKKSPWQGWFRRPLFATLCLLVVITSWLRTEGGIDHYVYRGVTLINDVFRTEYLRECTPSYRPSNDREMCWDNDLYQIPKDWIMQERIAAHPWVATLEQVTFSEKTPLIGGWIDNVVWDDNETWTTLAPTNLEGVSLVSNPNNLLDHTTERRRFRKTWCGRRGVDTEVCGRLYSKSEPPPSHLKTRRLSWCGQEQRRIIPADCQQFFDALDAEFRAEWTQFWNSRIDALGKLDLSGADLRHANINEAILIGVNLACARMDGVNLTRARLEGANLSQTRMHAANLWQARLEGTDFSGASIEKADLGEARMEGANLAQARLNWADLKWARLERADLRWAEMDGADLRWARMAEANLNEVQMKGANLNEARMESAIFSGARMQGTDLRAARMDDADLWQAQLQGAVLSGAQMEGTSLRWATMDGADLNSANLKSATVTESFAGTSVRGADLRSVSFTQEILNGVFGDTETKIPDDLTRPDHWDTETLEWFESDPKFEAWLASRKVGANPRE